LYILQILYNRCFNFQDVDQETGEDINPSQTRSLKGGDVNDETEARNPDRPTVQALLDMPDIDEVKDVKKGRRMTSPERWEINRMIAANVIDKSEYPDFDEETGLLPKEDDSGIGFLFKKYVQKIY
jgi:ATP-dependent RNA helicase DHX8/PRP22